MGLQDKQITITAQYQPGTKYGAPDWRSTQQTKRNNYNFKMIATILLQAATGFGSQQLIVFGLIAVVFYFFMIRPQVKKTKRSKKICYRA